MNQYIVAYFATAAVFLIIDYVWLTQVVSGFYANRLGDLLLDKPNYGVAAGFYLIFIIGIVIFAVAPAFKSGSVWTALVYGALFGFFAYATYELTNLATLKNWPVSIVAIDIIWGSVLTSIAAGAGFAISNYLGR